MSQVGETRPYLFDPLKFKGLGNTREASNKKQNHSKEEVKRPFFTRNMVL